MKKTLYASLFAFLTITTVFSSCKKDKDKEVAPTKDNVAGTYKMTSLKVAMNGTEAEADMEPCEKDNLYKLNADMSFSYIDAGTVCSPASDDTGTWTLNDNVISFHYYSFIITSFNGSTLQGTFSNNGLTLKGTFQKQ
jgi:hypothetical protein